MTLPPTDSGGPGHRPPDSTEDERHQRIPGVARAPTNATTPSIPQGASGGPHQGTTISSAGPDPFPALVTTPSDARGRKGTAAAGIGLAQRQQDGTGLQSDAAEPTQQPSYAAAVNQGGRHDRGSGGAPPKHVADTWNPRERHMLLATLAQAWGESSAPVDTTDQPLLRKVAMAPSKVHANDALRARTKQETQALLQYLNRTLELPHPPNFLKATLPLLQRAMVEQFHETHCEVTLTADILPRAKLRRSMTHNTLFAQLHAANSDSAAGKCMISRLLEDVKRLQFDGLHTLKFVFNSARVARLYTGLALRLNGTCIELEDTQDDATTGTYRLARLRRNYAVRAYGVDALGLVALLAALGRLDGVVVIDAERSRVESAEIVDNNYFLLRFTAEQCPDLLRGVTKLSVLGHVVTLHHHVIYQRMPCARCYAPYHTAGFCKANPAQLLRTQEKFQRTYKGPVPDYKVGTATQYLHTDEDSLTTFLATLHSELAGIAETQQDDAEPTTAANLVRAEAAAGPRPAQQRTTATEAMEVSQPGATKTLPTGTTDDGFTVVNRRQERPSKRNSTETPTTDAGPAETRQTGRKAPGGQASDVANGNSGGAQPPTAAAPTKTSAAVSNKKKTRGPAVTPKAQSKVKAYAKFKQAHALGRFAVLAEPEAEDQTVTDEEEEAEAPYAYPPDVADPLWTEMGEMVPDSAESETTYSQEGRATDASQPNPDADEIMLSAEGTVSSSYIGSSPPSQPRSWTTTQDLACPFSLQSDGEALQPQMEVETQAQPECGGSLPVHGEGEQRHRQPEEPTLNQDGFSLEQTKVAPGMPQQLPTFLIPFQGSLTTVPQNGQCAYAALYATMTTTTETALHFTADVVKGINFMKKSIYTLMLANLANDVDCKVVDPRRELRRLYPSQPAPTDTAVATAALYAHYTQERARTVNSQIPTAFWAGPEVLRAMAQYLREPLFVLDVDQHNDTHVQRYYYRDYTLPNGDTHETGCGGSMDDVTATDMLAHYARLHVLPVLLVLKGHEGHFCGVHHGDIAVKWHAEGDLEFTHANCSEQPWYSEVLAHIDYSQGLLAQVDYLSDDEATNTILIGAMERRARLDIVHDRLNMDRLDRDPYDIATLESGLRAEEDRLQVLAGTGSLVFEQGAAAEAEGRGRGAKRSPISPQGRVVLPTLQRILNAINMDPELVSDRSKFRQLKAENATAIRTWLRQGSQTRRQLTFNGGPADFIPLMRWLLAHRAEMQSLCRYVPYPEVMAKMIPHELLLQWGELEAYDLQIATLSSVIGHDDVPTSAKEYCRSWLAACTAAAGAARDRQLAKDPQRWKRLQGLYPAAPDCACPPGVREESWYILHTLPHAVWAWKATPWGCLPKSQLGASFKAHPAVQQVCQHIVDDAAWGFTVLLPTGITWGARLDAMAAGLAAAPRR